MNDFEIYEVVKEFEVYVGFDSVQKVCAKILRMLNSNLPNPYIWSISHYYRPSENHASVYRPSSRHGKTIEDAEISLMSYIQYFKDIEIKENESF